MRSDPQLEFEFESEWEAESEFEREGEEEAFLRTLSALGQRAARSPALRSVGLAAARSALGGLRAVDGHACPVCRARRAGQSGSAREWEWEGEFEDEFQISPIRRVYPDALMEHLAHAATEAESEEEAEAFIGALIPLAARLLPRVAPAIMRMTPGLVRGVAGITRTLRQNPTTRPLVRAVPTIVRRTVSSIDRQSRSGRPVTAQQAVRLLARQTAQTLGSPRQCAQALQRSRVLDRRYHAGVAPRRYRAAAGRRGIPMVVTLAGPAPTTESRDAVAARWETSGGEGRPALRPPAAPPSIATPWLRAQAINTARHAEALRPFQRAEFGTGAAAPSDGHVAAANRLIRALLDELLRANPRVGVAVTSAIADPRTSRLQQVVRHKEMAHDRVRAVEQVWNFYFELFGQCKSRFGDWLLSCDRIALDCYQQAFLGLGMARSIPAPPPFSYMRTGFSPATFRRGIPMRRLGRQLNSFPLVQLPYHRLVNPWTLGAVLHEVSHNLQNDLGLAQAVPRRIARALVEAGFGAQVAAIWTRWNRELFADVSGLLLGGPAVVGSLLDVIGRSPRATLHYLSRGPHPTPYLRAFISFELLRRMGFTREAAEYERLWRRIYPDPRAGNIPASMLDSFSRACALVVDLVCYRPFPSLGNIPLSQVIRFGQKEQRLIEEAAGRFASGDDPGVIPERFLIGASRIALDGRMAPPGQIVERFYRELARR